VRGLMRSNLITRFAPAVGLRISARTIVRQRLKKAEVKKLIERGAPTSGGKGMHQRPALSRLTQLVQQEVVPTQRSKGVSYVALGRGVGNC